MKKCRMIYDITEDAGGPHWLSPVRKLLFGKPPKEMQAIRDRHRARYLRARKAERKNGATK